MRRAARVDGPHAEIVTALRKCGCQVLDLSRVGGGCPDLLVRVGSLINVSTGGQRWGKYVLLEIKTARGVVRAAQKNFHALWPETVVVRSVSDALAVAQKR